MLKIYNSLGRTKQEFVPLRPGEVRMYVCGMTVYDYLHLGHARMLIAFDVVQRWLRASGYRVTYVRNITDIDDKIIRRALENRESIGELTARIVRCIDEDAAALGVQKPDHEPRATQYVPQMVDMIGRLEEKKLAYRSASGDVNFAVRRFPGYGKLSGKSLDELEWPSRYGEGRPGWHIECSAMGCALLGEHFDIHGGGEDLQFPHHENEIAQSEGANGVKFVNYWMHNGFLRVDEEKMSKSLGNFFTVREVLQRFDPEVVRFFILRAHYRSPLSYSDKHLEDAKQALTRLYTALKDSGSSAVDWNAPHARRFREAMDDDFGTPEAVAVLFELAHEIGRGRRELAPQLRALGGVLGLLQRDADAFLRGGEAGGWNAGRIAAREAARKRKDFRAADDIRRELLEKGIVLEDSPGGTTWRRT